MDEIEKCRKHFHMLLSLRGKALQRAIDKLPNHTIRCLYRIAVNLVFSPYNGLRTHSDLIKKKNFSSQKNFIKTHKRASKREAEKTFKKGRDYVSHTQPFGCRHCERGGDYVIWIPDLNHQNSSAH